MIKETEKKSTELKIVRDTFVELLRKFQVEGTRFKVVFFYENLDDEKSVVGHLWSIISVQCVEFADRRRSLWLNT
jgi:hypothetical protein